MFVLLIKAENVITGFFRNFLNQIKFLYFYVKLGHNARPNY